MKEELEKLIELINNFKCFSPIFEYLTEKLDGDANNKKKICFNEKENDICKIIASGDLQDFLKFDFHLFKRNFASLFHPDVVLAPGMTHMTIEEESIYNDMYLQISNIIESIEKRQLDILRQSGRSHDKEEEKTEKTTYGENLSKERPGFPERHEYYEQLNHPFRYFVKSNYERIVKHIPHNKKEYDQILDNYDKKINEVIEALEKNIKELNNLVLKRVNIETIYNEKLSPFYIKDMFSKNESELFQKIKNGIDEVVDKSRKEIDAKFHELLEKYQFAYSNYLYRLHDSQYQASFMEYNEILQEIAGEGQQEFSECISCGPNLGDYYLDEEKVYEKAFEIVMSRNKEYNLLLLKKMSAFRKLSECKKEYDEYRFNPNNNMNEIRLNLELLKQEVLKKIDKQINQKEVMCERLKTKKIVLESERRVTINKYDHFTKDRFGRKHAR